MVRVADRTLRLLGPLLAVLILIVGVAAGALSLTRGGSLMPRVAPTTVTDILLQAIPYTVVLLVAAFIVWRVPRNAIGWITNMQDRLDAIGGLLHITSAPGRGTSVQGTVPIGDAANVPTEPALTATHSVKRP